MISKYKNYLLRKILVRSIGVLGPTNSYLYSFSCLRTIPQCIEHSFRSLFWFEKMILGNCSVLFSVLDAKIGYEPNVNTFLHNYIVKNYHESVFVADLTFDIPNVKPKYIRISNFEFTQLVRFYILHEMFSDITCGSTKINTFDLSKFFKEDIYA